MTTTVSHPTTTCDPQTAVTRSLLGYGMIAGPLYVTVSLAQAATRDGFDLTRHAWSLLANGPHGWIQVINLILAGAMVLAFAAGLRRSVIEGPGATWAPRLVAVYGASLVAAGLFRADPALGFPVGTPEGATAVTWHGTAHFVAGGIGFSCLAAACFVLARRYARDGRRRLAAASRTIGIVFLAGFALMAGSGGSPAGTIAFTAAVVLVWGWLAVVAVDRYRATGASHS